MTRPLKIYTPPNPCPTCLHRVICDKECEEKWLSKFLTVSYMMDKQQERKRDAEGKRSCKEKDEDLQ